MCFEYHNGQPNSHHFEKKRIKNTLLEVPLNQLTIVYEQQNMLLIKPQMKIMFICQTECLHLKIQK